MRIAIVKRQPTRRRRIPRRPHPDLDFFFGRFERADHDEHDTARQELSDLDHLLPPQRRH